MKYENIISKLNADGYEIYEGCFLNAFVSFVNGVALVDIVGEEIKPTQAKYADVVAQIKAGKSHIKTDNALTIVNKA